jgi:NADH:ubiquinone oxidoreductase subunit E
METMATTIVQEVRALAEQHGRERPALVPVLQELHRRYARITDRLMAAVAREFDLPLAEVFGVVSFSGFSGAVGGRRTWRLCRGVACDLNGKAEVAAALEEALGLKFGQTSPDGRFALEWADCLGLCDQGPALLVDDYVFPRIGAAEARELVEVSRRTLAARDEGGAR